MNKYYGYPNKELWNYDQWKDRFSCVAPLARWISRKNHELFRFEKKKDAPVRPGAIYRQKICGNEYPTVVQAWADKGLRYYASSMTHSWIAMEPLAHVGKIGEDLTTLLVLVDADLKGNPDWTVETLEHYGPYNEMAAREGYLVLYVASNGPDLVGQYVSIVQEVGAIYHLEYGRLFLDVSTVYGTGSHLADVPEFQYRDEAGNPLSDPDAAVVWLGTPEIPALDIGKGRWANRHSLTLDLIRTDKGCNAAFDGETVVNSGIGRKLAAAVMLEHKFDDANDPDLVRYWSGIGLSYEAHDHERYRWLSMVPSGALGEPERKLPVMVTFKEVNTIDPHQAVTAFSYCREYIELAAQGDFILIFFACETQAENDMLHEILGEVGRLYPADRSRVYVSGHSHNGHFALTYAARHPGDIAAVATLGDAPGLEAAGAAEAQPFMPTMEQLQTLSGTDMPLINIFGCFERGSMIPLYFDAPDLLPSIKPHPSHTARKRMESWQLRLKTHGCPMKSVEEIATTEFSPDPVERMMGFPADRTDLLHLDGFDNFIADIRNNEGKFHLRMIALGGMPHCITPTMVTLMWSFLRRFARDTATGKCIERY